MHLYIHVPFCVRACDYCAFYKLAGVNQQWHQRYFDGLEKEIAHRFPKAEEPFRSIYIGGGTPSFLEVGDWQRLVTILNPAARLAADGEFAVEANPVSLTDQKLAVWRQAGVNRVTLGLQTFSDRLRAMIGRAGSAERVPAIVRKLRATGFANIGLDLIYGIPGQTMAELDEDLKRIQDLNPDHVSAYSLILEPGTPLARRLTSEADDELSVAMWERIGELLGTIGLERYEVSNLARPGYECHHNVDIWYGARFYGLGPSAAWFSGQSRWTNVPDLDQWLAGKSPAEDSLSAEERAAEIFASGLRTTHGWSADLFAERTGFALPTFRPQEVAALVQQGLLQWQDTRLQPTYRGLLFADYIARELL